MKLFKDEVAQVRALDKQQHDIIKGIAPQVIGRVVRARHDGRLYKVALCHLQSGNIVLEGHRVNGDKVGTRMFYISIINLVEFDDGE